MAVIAVQVASERDASINIDYKGTNYKLKSQQMVLSKVKELMDGIPKDTIDDSAEIIINMSKASPVQSSIFTPAHISAASIIAQYCAGRCAHI